MNSWTWTFHNILIVPSSINPQYCRPSHQPLWRKNSRYLSYLSITHLLWSAVAWAQFRAGQSFAQALFELPHLSSLSLSLFVCLSLFLFLCLCFFLCLWMYNSLAMVNSGPIYLNLILNCYISLLCAQAVGRPSDLGDNIKIAKPQPFNYPLNLLMTESLYA